MITRERLLEVLIYNPETGDFIWRTKTNRSVVVGSVAGSGKKGNYYREIRIDGHSYLAHRLAWLYMTGEWPDPEVDHKDTIKNHNAWDNLREATGSENQHNRGKPKNNTSGFKGITLSRGRTYVVRIMVDGVQKYMGSYATMTEARASHIAATLRFHGWEFGRV